MPLAATAGRPSVARCETPGGCPQRGNWAPEGRPSRRVRGRPPPFQGSMDLDRARDPGLPTLRQMRRRIASRSPPRRSVGTSRGDRVGALARGSNRPPKTGAHRIQRLGEMGELGDLFKMANRSIGLTRFFHLLVCVAKSVLQGDFSPILVDFRLMSAGNRVVLVHFWGFRGPFRSTLSDQVTGFGGGWSRNPGVISEVVC